MWNVDSFRAVGGRLMCRRFPRLGDDERRVLRA